MAVKVTEADWLSEEDCLALRGGLKGRMAKEFCVLQGQSEALYRYMDCHAPEPLRSAGMKTLAEMRQSITVLERLAKSACWAHRWKNGRRRPLNWSSSFGISANASMRNWPPSTIRCA